MRIAFDMSSVMWTALSVGKNEEFGQEILHNEKKVWVNGWQYGYENAVNLMVSAINKFGLAPKDAILAFEGMSSKKQRMMIDPTYKESRGDRPAQAYEQFQKLKEVLATTFGQLGSAGLTQDFVEGDDLLAYLAKHSEDDLVIVTNDGDLSTLSGVNDFGARITVRVNGEDDLNKFGPFPHRLIPVYKALVGDTSDNIKGCVGFGKVAFLTFVSTYGDEGLEEMLRLLESGSLEELATNAEEDKLIRKIYDQRDGVLKSYRLAKLRPDWCNTMMHPLKWTPGMCLPAQGRPDERLATWYGSSYLVTGDKFESACKWALPFIQQSEYVGLDIETSAQEEGEDWLAAQGSTDGVDVIGAKLTGLSITFGKNLEKTLYFSVDHADTVNCDSTKLRDFMMSLGKPLVIQNAAGFELPVLKLNWDVWLPNAIDTRIEATYVNENLHSHGLKNLSKTYLNYDQVNYQTVTTVEEGVNEDGTPKMVQKRMNQLSAKHVLSYACDDTITCSALHNWFKLMMELEHHFDVFNDVEVDAYYLGAQAFVDGACVSRKRLSELTAKDQAHHDEAWVDFRDFLIARGWPGTVPPQYTKDITAAEVKAAYQIVTNEELDTRARLIVKLAAAAEEAGQDLFAQMLRACAESDEGAEKFTAYIQAKFTGEPIFKMSPKQKGVILYELLGLPVRLRNPATENMRKAGIREGNPKTDALALAYAVKYDAPEHPEIAPIISGLQQMQIVLTRQGLYYKPYPNLIHWLTDRLHAQVQQSATNTRRWTAARPNVQQMSKHPKADGETPEVREIIVPHHKDAVIVSFDEAAQELRVIAHYSRDDNMVACFVGDDKKDMHALTGTGILNNQSEYRNLTYVEFMERYISGDKIFKDARTLGKKVNFTTEFGAMAPKLASTLIVSEEEAQAYIDAKEAAFPGVRVWKDAVIEEAKRVGHVRTMCGAVRHLADAFMSEDRQESSKAERQAVNYKVQSSSAEMIKRAMGAMLRARIRQRFDCVFYFPVHDEVVWSCAISDLPEFIPAVHACMVQPFADMSIPIESSIAFGRSFGPADQIEIGSTPSLEAINKGLQKMYEMEKETA